MLYNVCVVYQCKDLSDKVRWFHTEARAMDFAQAEDFHPWMAAFNRDQLTGQMFRFYERGQRK